MRIFLFILLGFVFGAAMPLWAQDEAESPAVDEAPFDASTLREDGQIIAFVGKKVFVRRENTDNVEKDENGEDNIVIRTFRYEARYEILDLVSGDYQENIIDFHTTSHRASNSTEEHELSDIETVLFILTEEQESGFSNENYTEVHRTTDGDWATCGNVYTHYDTDHPRYAREPLEPITFLEPIMINVPSLKENVSDFFDENEIISDTDRAESQADIDEYYKFESGLYRPPIWKRDGDIATCQMGTRVQDLYEFQYQTWILPEKREKICEARHEDELEALKGDYDAKTTLLDDCKSLLKIQNLP